MREEIQEVGNTKATKYKGILKKKSRKYVVVKLNTCVKKNRTLGYCIYPRKVVSKSIHYHDISSRTREILRR